MSEIDAPSVGVQTRRSPVYLSPEKARLWLIGENLFTEETVPSLEDLADIILEIEDRIDEWLERRVAPTQYTETDVTNHKGIALMSHYPVLSVEEIALYPDAAVGGTKPQPIEPGRILGIWRQDRRLYLWERGLVLRVRYTAGLDPIPRIFTTVAFEVLSRALQRSARGSLAFLELPFQEREVASISLPGGLSKSFRTYRPSDPKGSGSGAGGSITELDRLLAPLAKYRYPVVTT